MTNSDAVLSWVYPNGSVYCQDMIIGNQHDVCQGDPEGTTMLLYSYIGACPDTTKSGGVDNVFNITGWGDNSNTVTFVSWSRLLNTGKGRKRVIL